MVHKRRAWCQKCTICHVWNTRHIDKVLFTLSIPGISNENKTNNILGSGLLQAALLETMDGTLGISGYVIFDTSQFFSVESPILNLQY
jgi:hypothetical protein